MKFEIPQNVEWILQQLNTHGYEAYAVGGCVRDMLLGREPEDWDITTSATPQQVKEVFRRTVDTGIEHGTVTVMIDRQGYEVTTYRLDGEYEDGRHPKSVEFTRDLLEDLKRRDFTINAMAYSHNTGIVDAFGGQNDLENHIIRCVGTPEDRFTEDALRILRAIRFSAQLDFKIDPATRRAIIQIAPNIIHVSKERIQTELTKLLLSGNPEHIRLVFQTGISPYISEEYNNIDPTKLQISAALPASKHLRWSAFLHVVSPQSAQQIMRDLKMDNDTTNRVRTLVQWHSVPIPQEKAAIRKLMSQMTLSLYDDLLILKANISPLLQSLEELNEITRLTTEIRQANDCITLKDLAVNGSDLIAFGLKPGKEIGTHLTQLFELVLEYPEYNDKQSLLKHLAQKEPNNPTENL